MQFLSRNTILLVFILAIFCLIYCLISLVNHYEFRTFALDLGMFNHALYCFAHLKPNYFTLDIAGAEINYFGVHFSPITFLYVPFYYLFGSYTLLIIQVAAILFGGYGIFKYASYTLQDRFLPFLFLVQFLSLWGITSALSYDFHNNVVAAMLVPWLIYSFEKRDRMKILLFFVLILFAMENMSLWLAFIVLGLMLKHHKLGLKSFLKLEIPLFLVSLLYFIVVVCVVMPAIAGPGFGQLNRYAYLGSSLPEIVVNAISHPLKTLMLVFENPTGEAIYNGIKGESHFMILVSGGIAFFFRPAYMVMLFPVYLQKFLSDNYLMWGINGQHSIEFIPLISLALVDLSRWLRGRKWKYGMAILFTLTTIGFTGATMEHRKSLWYTATNTAFYSKEHYRPGLDLKAIYHALKLIPSKATLSVCPALAPHLASRERIYHFPVIRDAEYVALFTAKRGTYPLTEEEFNEKIGELKESGEFHVVYEENDLVILRRIRGSTDTPEDKNTPEK